MSDANRCSGKSVDHVVEVGLELVQSLGAHVARCASAIAGEGECFHVGAGGQTQGAVHLTGASDAPLVQRTGAANNQAVVDQAQVVAQIAVALVNLGLVLTSLTGLLEVGVLVEAGIAGFLGYSVEASSQLFSGFEASGGALDVALDGLEVVLGGERPAASAAVTTVVTTDFIVEIL